MSARIITAIRQHTQLRTVTRTIAIEIAHRMSSSGIGRIAYSFLAHKAACSIRTAIRHVKKLVDLGLFRKRTTKAATGYGWNVYEYTGPRSHLPAPSVTARYAIRSASLPLPAREEEKALALRAEIAQLRKGLLYCTTGSDAYESTSEKIARLEGLLRC